MDFTICMGIHPFLVRHYFIYILSLSESYPREKEKKAILHFISPWGEVGGGGGNEILNFLPPFPPDTTYPIW